MNVACSDWVYVCVVDSGLAGRIRELDVEVPDVDLSANCLRSFGSVIAGELGVKRNEHCGFESRNALHLALGAFAVEELSPVFGYQWRSDCKKTLIWNLSGDGLMMDQVWTNRDDFFVTGANHVVASEICWPVFLGCALQYFVQVNPGRDVESFVGEYFKMWRSPFEKHLYAESLTTEEIVNSFVPPPGIEGMMELVEGKRIKKRLEQPPRMSCLQLQELFSKPLPDGSVKGVKPVVLSSRDRAYFVYVLDNSLYVGIEDRCWRDWEEMEHAHVIDVNCFGRNFRVNDYITFQPADSEHLLKACLNQYVRDRAQVPEIVDYFVWGRNLDKGLQR